MKIAVFFKGVDEGGVYTSHNASGDIAYIASFSGKTFGFQSTESAFTCMARHGFQLEGLE